MLKLMKIKYFLKRVILNLILCQNNNTNQLNVRTMNELIEIKNLIKEFPIQKGFFNKKVGAVHAINNISIDIYKGETLGLVGESGCGKSTTGRCILGLESSTSGTVLFDGIDTNNCDDTQKKELKKRMQIIFQNPYSSLNPRMTIYDTIKEPIAIHKHMLKSQIDTNIKELLDVTGLPSTVLNKYPHEFSGGQRQRIGIARALVLNPEFIVADEPVSALDVSIQAQIINLLQNLKEELGLTYLFISHDLSVVKYISDRVAVMYLGEIVELATTGELFNNPKHPYTQALLSAIPTPDPNNNVSRRILLTGDIPSPTNPPQGCKFHTRCKYVMDICKKEIPPTYHLQDNHQAACYLLREPVSA